MFLARLLRAFVPSPGERSLFRNASFVRVWLSATLNTLGGSVSQLAIPLTAVQLLHANAVDIRILFACGGLPFVFLGLPAGVWIDRCSRRRVILQFNLMGGAALASVPIGAALGVLSVPWLCVVEFLVGAAYCVGGSAQQVFVTDVVGRDRLLEANSKQAAATSVASLVGPILAGLLVAWLEAPMAVAIDALMFWFAAALIGGVAHREAPRARSTTPWLADAFTGLKFVWNHPLLRAFAVMAAMCLFVFDGFMALFVLHATRNLHLTAGQVAFVNTMAALGALSGATLVRPLNRRLGKFVVIPLGFALAPVGFLVFAAAPAGARAVPLAGLALFVVQAGMTAYTVNYLATRQLVTPDHLLGRMTTTMRFLSVSAAPVGATLSGLLANRLGVVPVLVGLGLVGLAAALLAHNLIRRALEQGAGQEERTLRPAIELRPQEAA